MNDIIMTIADYHGVERQKKKALEEMVELMDAIMHDDSKGIIEEIGDVEIILEQLKYLLDIKDYVNLSKRYKTNRELLRIAEAEEKRT